VRISPTGFAPPGAALAASQQFGISNQTDVFTVDSSGALTVSWVVGGGTWAGPVRISPTGFAPPGAALAASQQFGISNQTDVFAADRTFLVNVSWVVGGGTWAGPVALGASASGLMPVSRDPYSGGLGQHVTEVEPDTYQWGPAILGVHQTARINDGGAMNIGWEFSPDAGRTWRQGFLTGITTTAGGTHPRASDPSVVYDARHGTWLVQTLAFGGTPEQIIIARSTDGVTWSASALSTQYSSGSLDKNWITCDNWASSPHYGTCYGLVRDLPLGRLVVNASTDGGATWSAGTSTPDSLDGCAQILVRPDGRVVMLSGGCPRGTTLRATVSTDGGNSWTASQFVVDIARFGSRAANLRGPETVNAEVDGSGRIYAMVPGCVFRPSCTADDLVLVTSPDGVTWDPPRRIPGAASTSSVSAAGGGIGVDRATGGAGAKVGVFYYYFTDAACTTSTCQLYVGYLSSTNGGQTWSAPVTVAGPMAIADLPATTLGSMVGDYISASVDAGRAHSVFPVSRRVAGSTFDQAMYAIAEGLPVTGGTNPAITTHLNAPNRTPGASNRTPLR
jgi:hypothetical protein